MRKVRLSLVRTWHKQYDCLHLWKKEKKIEVHEHAFGCSFFQVSGSKSERKSIRGIDSGDGRWAPVEPPPELLHQAPLGVKCVSCTLCIRTLLGGGHRK